MNETMKMSAFDSLYVNVFISQQHEDIRFIYASLAWHDHTHSPTETHISRGSEMPGCNQGT